LAIQKWRGWPAKGDFGHLQLCEMAQKENNSHFIRMPSPLANDLSIGNGRDTPSCIVEHCRLQVS
jgi:hypothetical protein